MDTADTSTPPARRPRWPHDPRIDLRAIPGFDATGHAADRWAVAPRLRGISRQADLHIAGAIALLTVLAGGALLLAPDPLIAAVLP